jgi:hypothetical protein
VRRAPVALVLAFVVVAALATFGAPSTWAGATIAAALVASCVALGRAFDKAPVGDVALEGAGLGVAAVLTFALVAATYVLPLSTALAAHDPSALTRGARVAAACVAFVVVLAAAWVGARALSIAAPRASRACAGALALAAFFGSSALVYAAARRPGGELDVDTRRWVAVVDYVGQLPAERVPEASRSHRVADGVIVDEDCGEDAPACVYTVRGASPVALVGPLVAPASPAPADDLEAAPSLVLRRDDATRAWILESEGRVLDAATERGPLHLSDVGARLAVPRASIVVAAVGLVVAALWLGLGARWLKYAREVSRGVAGAITDDGWLELPGHDPVRVRGPDERVTGGAVVVLSRGARAPSYRGAPVGAVCFAAGDQRALLATADATARQLFATALVVVALTAAPLAVAMAAFG